MRVPGQAVFAGIITAVFAAASLMALELSAQARLLPLIIGVPGVLLGVFAVMKEMRSATPRSRKSEASGRQEAVAIGWIAGFWLAILLFGFAAGAPLVTATYLALALRKGLVASAAGGLACLLLTWGLFERTLHVALFPGLLLH